MGRMLGLFGVFVGGVMWGQGSPGAAPQVATQTGKAPTVNGQAGAKPDTVMTKQQGKELLDAVDGVMTFVAADSGLPAVVKVKRRLVGRDEVSAFLEKSFAEDEGAKRLQRSEVVLKKFGMLSRDFNLRPFLLTLLREQIAGFYDAKTKTVNLLNWVAPDLQKPVLAHELTHAVQDQKVGLETWGNTGFKGVSKTGSEDAARVAQDEQDTARQAVTEGQAMVVFVDWTLKETGHTLAEVPNLGEALKEGLTSSADSPVLARAPLLLQRSLEFPYTDGLLFEQFLLQKGGKKLAFAGVLDRPPVSSAEVMHPEQYLAYAAQPVVRLPDVHPLLDKEYEPYDLGVMGELDVEIMATLFGGPEAARALAPAWAGGVYYAGQRRAASAEEKTGTGSLGVMYFSRWKTDEAARAFAEIYAGELGRKYDKLAERKGDEGVGEQVFSTGEGDVLISRDGVGLFVAEGLPVALARKLRDEVTAVQGTGPMQRAGVEVPGRELVLPVVGMMARVGVRCTKASAGVDRMSEDLR